MRREAISENRILRTHGKNSFFFAKVFKNLASKTVLSVHPILLPEFVICHRSVDRSPRVTLSIYHV